MTLPEKLQEIVDDFSWASREEKMDMLVQYAESLPPLPEWLHGERDKMEPVPECMTPVFLSGEKDAGGGIHFHFNIPPQSPTVQGLAAILAYGLDGLKLEEILAVPANFYTEMNLQDTISHQRLNGFQGLLAHMKQVAVRLATES
jgi:cysteine desulfuration protein SufE